MFRQVPADALEVVALEEPRPDVPFLEHWNVRLRMERPALHRQGERALDDRELAVDAGRLRLRLEACRRVGADVRGRNGRHPAAAEERLQVQRDAGLDVVNGASLIR